MTARFLSSDLQKFAQGSFEHLIARLDAALSEGAQQVFGEGVEHRVIATFADHVIALSSDGRVARLSFTEDETGIQIGEHEFLEVTSVSEEDRDSTLQAEVRETLRGILTDEPEAERRLASLVANIH